MISDHRLRVAIYDPSGQGGICHYTYQLAQNLALKGNDVTVLTSDNFELIRLTRNFKVSFLFKQSWIKRCSLIVLALIRSQHSKYKNISSQELAANITSTDSKIGTLMRNLRLKIRWLKAASLFVWKRPHLIHLQWLVDRNEDHFFVSLLKLLHFKIVYTVHDLLPLESEAHPDYKAIDRMYHRVDALVVHTESNKKELLSAFKVDPKKIHVIPHGSNDMFFTAATIPKGTAKEELGLSRQNKVILFFGSIKKYKGLEYLVEAFQEIKEQVADVTLLIVGKIYNKDVKGFKYYTELIGRLRCRKDVICVEDYVPLGDIAMYFAASDVVVLPYVENYTSGVLLSAYAAGRPVVVTDTGGLKESVEIGKSGFVVPPRDTKALARAIIATIASPERCDEMGRYARWLGNNNYSWSTVASKTIELYRLLTVKSAIADTTTEVNS